MVNVVRSAMPVIDAGQRDRQQQEERDRVLAEEVVALHGERGERAQDRARAIVATVAAMSEFVTARMIERVVGRLDEPVQREARRRPGLDAARVERVDRQDDDRQVEERQDAVRGEAQQRS